MGTRKRQAKRSASYANRHRRLHLESLEDRRLLTTFDFGDAPDSYSTLDASGGPKHQIPANPTLFLGSAIDAEPDGQPDSFAEDDDDDQFPNDEDGVFSNSLFILGQQAEIVVTASAMGELDGWLDFNGNGVFDHPTEHINNGTSIFLSTAGQHTINFTLPTAGEGGVAGETYARLRFSDAGDLLPGGMALDGEVEDYQVEILASGSITHDYGDAPDSYDTLESSGGPKHQIGTLFLGDIVDGEPDGQPAPGALNDDDDQTANDDDGVVSNSLFILGQTAQLVVKSSQAGNLDGWMDLNGNGSFEHPGEHINGGTSIAVVPGNNNVNFNLPTAAQGGVAGTSYARLRVSTLGGLTPGGSTDSGEVEDYEVTIFPEGTSATQDYGDAPNSYSTLDASGGPKHTIGALFLGSSVDGEPDGIPEAHAEGDDFDQNPNDENGIVSTSRIELGTSNTVVVNASGAGKLDAWIDVNGNGVFDHPSEHINAGTSVNVVAGDNTINFDLPAAGKPGDTFARIRLSTAGNLSPTGAAADGEVEDYGLVLFGDVPDRIGVFNDNFFYLDATDDGSWNGVAGGDLFRDYHPGGARTDYTPVVGDWDGDGIDNLGVFNDNFFYLDTSGNGLWDGVAGGDTFRNFHPGSDRTEYLPVIGDWDGNGTDDIGVYNDNFFYLDGNSNGGWNGVGGGDTFHNFHPGGSRMDYVPVAGDWDGDETDDIGVHNNNFFYLDTNGNGAWNTVGGGDTFHNFHPGGARGDYHPIAGDWTGSGTDGIGVFNDGFFYLDATGNGTWSTVAGGDTFHNFHPGGARTVTSPVIGNWPEPAPLLAAEGPAEVKACVIELTDHVLTPVVELATSLLDPAGASHLSNLDVRIADLPGAKLGEALGNTIWIDVDAAGHGWHVDTSARELVFASSGATGHAQQDDTPEQMDLLTVVLHELGHVLGNDHELEGLMDDILSVGERRLP